MTQGVRVVLLEVTIREDVTAHEVLLTLNAALQKHAQLALDEKGKRKEPLGALDYFVKSLAEYKLK